MKRVAVALSGGVDSAVAAALLKEQGYQVLGVTLRLWDGSGNNPLTAARAVAEQLAIPFQVYDLTDEFRRRVIEPFCHAYLHGLTPNPCIVCNQFLKFGHLLDLARELGTDYLATGHYVDLARVGDWLQVRKGRDRNKDQSYFLFSLSQSQLSRCLFPLGRMTKDEVRAYAAQANLAVFGKSESQDICFVPDGDYVAFLKKACHAVFQPGKIIYLDGRELGEHAGTCHFTVGQRKGLGVSWPEPLYVIALDAEKRLVVVGEKTCLDRRELTLNHCNWNCSVPTDRFSTLCRIRYRHQECPAWVTPLSDDRAEIVFPTPQRGVAPGQAAVFYDEDRVIGGGWIEA